LNTITISQIKKIINSSLYPWTKNMLN